MQKISPYFWFNDQAEAAANFYTSIFKNGRINDVARYGADMPGPEGEVMITTFHLAGQEFTALNGGPLYSITPAISFFVTCETEEEIDALWANLTEGGMALMEYGQYPFSEKFGWVMDKFGVSWQLSLARQPQKITPYLMFVGQQHGRAEEAMNLYTSLFKNSGISHIERYGAGETDPEGSVKHARFQLDGQAFMAMDSAYEHDFTFTPAISLLVDCKTQEEVDYLWDRLLDGGSEDACGWLVDKFGVSWQIVPSILGELMGDPDPQKAGRVAQAMLKMKKLDIAVLKQAYEAA